MCSRIIDAKITDNNIKIIKLTTEGISDVYQLFSDSLARYLDSMCIIQKNNYEDLREQVLNRFDDVISDKLLLNNH